ncbi:IcmT/TraK family protein [Roseivivax sp. CAU 1761]
MAHWRNTFKAPRFFFFDARLAVFLVGFLLHIRLWTLLLLIAVFAAFYWVERYGYDFASALRAIRLYFAGPVRNPVPDERMPQPRDYDRRPLF